VLELLSSLAPRLAAAHTPVFQWTVTDGLRRLDVNLGGAQQHNAEPAAVLKSVRASNVAGIYILLDFHPFLADPVHVRLLKDICQNYDRTQRTVVLISHEVALPRELEHLAARFRLAFPNRVERQAIIERVAGDWTRTNGGKVRTDRKSLDLLIENLAGLSVGDTERLARNAIFDDGALLPSDLPAVMKAKYELLNRGGVLSFEYDTAQFADLGRSSRRPKACCCSASRVAARASRLVRRPASTACRCCGWISARSTTSTSASRSATCARRWRRPR
jgi:hypothetical protein